MSYHVLVPVDWSAQSRNALDHVAEHFPDADVTVLYVVDPRAEHSRTLAYPGYRSEAEFKSEVEKATHVLELARERAENAGLDVRTETAHGEPSRAIVRFAENNDVDHVVMGSHGRDGVARFLLGSVAETVARRSPVPVTLVRK